MSLEIIYKHDISSFESSNHRTPRPDIELEDLTESEESPQGNPSPELLNKAFKFRDPELIHLDEMDKADEAVQRHPG